LNDNQLYCTRVKVGIICGNVSVDNSSDMDSGGVKNWGSPLLVGWVLQLQH